MVNEDAFKTDPYIFGKNHHSQKNCSKWKIYPNLVFHIYFEKYCIFGKKKLKTIFRTSFSIKKIR